eukprot:3667389-Pyramimonas_sp.AAC.1
MKRPSGMMKKPSAARLESSAHRDYDVGFDPEMRAPYRMSADNHDRDYGALERPEGAEDTDPARG